MADTKRIIEFDYNMKVSTINSTNIVITSDTPNDIVGTVEVVDAWDGALHAFRWTCTSNGEFVGVTGTITVDPESIAQFTVGDVITQENTSATATISVLDGTDITLIDVIGIFNETDTVSNAEVDASGTLSNLIISAASAELNEERSFTMAFSEDILDVLNCKAKIDPIVFGAI